MLRFYVIFSFFIVQMLCQAQSVYMHEAQEDAMEQEREENIFVGISGTILLFGIIYVIATLHDSYNETKERRENYRRAKSISNSIANKTLHTAGYISKYQHKKAWQIGYKRAVYDKLYGTPQKLVSKTIDDLIIEYRHLCELGHIIQADKIMEQIGYFQCLENKNI